MVCWSYCYDRCGCLEESVAMPYSKLEKKKAIKDQNKNIKRLNLNVGYVLIDKRLVDIRER